jgi:type I restriction enzyme M protein
VAEARAEIGHNYRQDGHGKSRDCIDQAKGQRDKAAAKIAERDEKIAEARRRSEDDRRDVEQVGAELGGLYGSPDELLKHARVVQLNEIEENEFNLNIPRYVDTFEPERRVQVKDALREMHAANCALASAEDAAGRPAKGIGYAK